jgi:hypothetical protein
MRTCSLRNGETIKAPREARARPINDKMTGRIAYLAKLNPASSHDWILARHRYQNDSSQTIYPPGFNESHRR